MLTRQILALTAAWLLWGGTGAMAEAYKTVVFVTVPDGAQILQNGQPIGVSGQPVSVQVPDANQDVVLSLSAPGYQPHTLTIHAYALRDRYPSGNSPPISLEPDNAWVPLEAWVASHVGATAVTLVGLVALGVGAFFFARPFLVDRRKLQSARVEGVAVDLVGKRLGDLDVVERLGSGGTAEVYRANGPQGEVAVKVMHVVTGDPGQIHRQRFLREVKVLQTLSHPAIIRLLDWGEQGDLMYLVEELAEGGHVGQKVPPGGLAVRDFVGYFVPVVDAIRFAHQHGVVHRDLKPENLLLTRGGQVKVSDFGLARIEAGTRLTANNMMGTPLYMAPEQFAGKPATPATDQYALGILAYELLSSRMPFPGDSLSELMARRGQPPPRLSSLVSVPAELEAAIERMMARTAEERFPSLDPVLDVLRRGT